MSQGRVQVGPEVGIRAGTESGLSRMSEQGRSLGLSLKKIGPGPKPRIKARTGLGPELGSAQLIYLFIYMIQQHPRYVVVFHAEGYY